MTSKAEASLICKSFGANLVPDRAPDVGLLTVLKKRADDATLSLAFTDATLRDPRSLAGVVLTAEKPLGGGVKGALSYFPARSDALGSVTIDKQVNGNDLTLKASYQYVGDVFTLQETWKFNKQNKLVGTYNFAKEEAVFHYEHTRGALKLGATYSVKSEKPTLMVERKQGKHTLAASYGPKDDAAMLSWSHKPYKVVVRGKAGRSGLKGVTAVATLTHEFEL